MKWHILFRLSVAFLFICFITIMGIWLYAALGNDVTPYLGVFMQAVLGFFASCVGVGASSRKL